MNIIFLGGTETVTGSKFLLETKTTRVLVDCGMFQGYKWLRERNWETLPFDIKSLDAVILTHAHLDHSGLLPVLYKRGYRGPIYTHHATHALCKILLADSAHLQEESTRYIKKHRLSKHAHPEPLYDVASAAACIKLFKTLDFEETAKVGEIEFHLQGAGHILGAASVILQAEGKRIGFSGDVGKPEDILMKPPKPLPPLDLLLLESTYGDRQHESIDPMDELEEIVNQTIARGGMLMVPSFAVGRAQTLQLMFNHLIAEKRIPEIPIYLDSPMAIDVSDIYCQFSEFHQLSKHECQTICHTAKLTRSVEESKALFEIKYPHIVIAGSGMATGGRILHHFLRRLTNPRNTVLFTGYQVNGTRGAKMMNGASTVKVFGKWLPVKAEVKVLHGMSGHADYIQMTRWLGESALSDNTRIELIHGDPEALEAMRDHLRQHTPYTVNIAGYKRILRL